MCKCFDDFRANLPKNFGRFHRKENTNFPKRRRVRSKIVFLSSAGLFSLVVTKKSVLRTSSDLYLKQYVFFVQMQSHVSAARFLERWKGWPMPPKPRHKLSKMLSPSKNIALSCARLVSLLWDVREIDLREVLPVLVVLLVVFLFQQRQCPTELEKWPWSVCLKFFGQKDLRKDYF